MRIALLDPPSYSPDYDHHLAAALGARGHEVELITSPFAFGEPPAPEGYERRELFLPLSARLLRRAPRSRLRRPLKALEYGPSIVRLLGHLRRMRPDVVNVQWLPAGTRDLVWARRLPRPRVFTAHNVLPHEGQADVEARLRLYSTFDRIVVHTERGVEQLERFGVPAERVVRIRHGTFDGPVEPPNGRTLLFFGLIRRYKGLDVLVRALSEVRDAQLVVAGDPLDPVEPTRQLADELGVSDRIEWRLGYLPQHEVEALMRDATVTVFPYHSGESASGTLHCPWPRAAGGRHGAARRDGAGVRRRGRRATRRSNGAGDSDQRASGRPGRGIRRDRTCEGGPLVERDRGGSRAALLRAHG
jgi:glycosyltransferase involved in cell wall biosynthesis